jgi:hypothetical protein
MRNFKRPANCSVFSQVIIFIVVFLVFTSTTVKAYPDDPSVITQVLKNLYNVLFDPSASNGSSTIDESINQATESSSIGDTTAVTGRDPWDVPPAPPPPPTQE